MVMVVPHEEKDLEILRLLLVKDQKVYMEKLAYGEHQVHQERMEMMEKMVQWEEKGRGVLKELEALEVYLEPKAYQVLLG